MNGLQHSQIGRAAVDILSDGAFAFWNSQREILAEASNFPDLFWGGENADLGYLKRYREWRV